VWRPRAPARLRTAAASGGYACLREILADPADEEHDDILAWLGLEKAGDFDPYGFDVDTAKRALTAVGALR
jgi:hypothetical protein